MDMIKSFPSVSVETAWNRYVSLVMEARRNPLLFENDNHTKARRDAHKRFVGVFRLGGANG